MLVRFEERLFSCEVQWTATDISEILNKQPSSQSADLYVNCAALSHGLSLFQKQLNKMGLVAVPVATLSKAIPDFFDLIGAQRIIEVRFSSYSNNPPKNESISNLIERMVAIRNSLLLKNNYDCSPYSSPSSVFGNLHYPMIQKILNKKNTDQKKHRVVRKSPSKLRKKAIRTSTGILVKSAEKEFGEKHSLFYLQSAVKIASDRKRKFDARDDDDKENNIEESEDEEGELELDMINDNFENDDKIIQATADLPRKYIVFGEEDQNNMLNLLEIVREVASRRDYKEVNNISISATAQILSEFPYYSQASERTLNRWYTSRDITSNKPGRKINEKFESEVWGNLMLCIFEKNGNEVSYSNIQRIIIQFYYLF